MSDDVPVRRTRPRTLRSSTRVQSSKKPSTASRDTGEGTNGSMFPTSDVETGGEDLVSDTLPEKPRRLKAHSGGTSGSTIPTSDLEHVSTPYIQTEICIALDVLSKSDPTHDTFKDIRLNVRMLYRMMRGVHTHVSNILTQLPPIPRSVMTMVEQRNGRMMAPWDKDA